MFVKRSSTLLSKDQEWISKRFFDRVDPKSVEFKPKFKKEAKIKRFRCLKSLKRYLIYGSVTIFLI